MAAGDYRFTRHAEARHGASPPVVGALRQGRPSHPLAAGRAHAAQAPMPRPFDAHAAHRSRGNLDGVRRLTRPPPPVPTVTADAALVTHGLH